MEDKIILRFKTKNILNFYEIEPWSNFTPNLNFYFVDQKFMAEWLNGSWTYLNHSR